MARPKSENPDTVRSERVLINVTPPTLARIDEFSERLRMSRSEFLNNLIEMGLDDNEFGIKLVSSVVVPAQDLLSLLKRKVSKT